MPEKPFPQTFTGAVLVVVVGGMLLWGVQSWMVGKHMPLQPRPNTSGVDLNRNTQTVTPDGQNVIPPPDRPKVVNSQRTESRLVQARSPHDDGVQRPNEAEIISPAQPTREPEAPPSNPPQQPQPVDKLGPVTPADG